MASLLPDIRNAVRACICRDGEILLLEKVGSRAGGTRYALPGGTQETGESLHSALQRECVEEIGTEVAIGGLISVADFYKWRSSRPAVRRHVVEFLFACRVPEDYVPGNGPRPDKRQVGVAWVPLPEVTAGILSPHFLTAAINQASDSASYLGAFNDHDHS